MVQIMKKNNAAEQMVNCLGREFASEETRREYFREELRKKLQETDFRNIEGFPQGSDEDILNLSDPPYYTACPNPWVADFVAEWESQKPADQPAYHREPFAADVSEGKNDPIYNAHSYHTKVPHKAIMRYILHYTEPGDIVFDGFCGTGMTGVAAQMCANKEVVESLGFLVDDNGVIYEKIAKEDEKEYEAISFIKNRNTIKTTEWRAVSKLGARHAILNDLSPAATFIAYNYNTPVDVKAFEAEAKRILKEVEEECGWMYETLHTDGKTKGKINYTVWSDVFVCTNCMNEVIFWEAAVDKKAGKVKDEFPCPHCQSLLTKRNMDRAWITKHDSAIGQTIRQAKQVPVLINYSTNAGRSEKTPDAADLAQIEKIENSDIPYWFPTDELPDGKETKRNCPVGITHVHHFYTKRNLWVLASLIYKRAHVKDFFNSVFCHFLFQQWAIGFSKLNRYSQNHFSQNNRNLSGTLYVGSTISEVSLDYAFKEKLKRLIKAFDKAKTYNAIVETHSTSSFVIKDNVFDYIFIDPPFGANLNYSELNFIWESWLKVVTNNKPEAIENSVQGKGLSEYRQLMLSCFREAYRILKPGRWMTVEFSNTKNSVWNNIQTALSEAGFIVANVSILDKKQGSFKAVTTPTAVKEDLVISAYKPNGGFEERFVKEVKTEEGVWSFVRTHLKYLPVVKTANRQILFVPERDPRILFDRMVAYYVFNGYQVPLSSSEFQEGLHQRFSERDGMFFLSDQTVEYDKAKMKYEMAADGWISIFHEESAIFWLRSQLKKKPQSYQDLHAQFFETARNWVKYEKQIELRTLLEQNFFCFNGIDEVPSQIHSYLSTNWPEMRLLSKDDPALVAKATNRWYVPDPNKAGDLEKLRERTLLREFDEYKQAQKKLKVFRMEAVRAGFKKCWQEGEYDTIIKIATQLPRDVLEEDPKLLMWYDQALTRKEHQTSK
jgi:DNA modification methylase